MPQFSVNAEYDRLDAVRLHTPGLELWSGAVDPEPNLFDDHVAPDQARREHERIADTLAGAGVEVHQLADDLADAGTLDSLVREYATLPDETDVEAMLSTFDPREKLQLVLARPSFSRKGRASHVDLDWPISNIHYQRDTTILGDKGPVLCKMGEPVRQFELPIVRRAWEGLGTEFAYEMQHEPLEGGEFLPAGEFALVGVSAEGDGDEEVIRTTYAAGRELLDNGAVGYDEVGLVRAPLAADRKNRAEHGIGSRVLHLLGWLNIAAEGLAVTDPELARHATVDVYARRSDGYELDRSLSTLDYLDEQGYDVVELEPTERWAANFLAVDDGVVVPLYEPDENGEYRPENNRTLERLKERGVTVLPDGEGLPQETLTRGAGGIHCMTTPLNRS